MNMLNGVILEGIVTNKLRKGFSIKSKRTFPIKESVNIDVYFDDNLKTWKNKLEKDDTVRVFGRLKQVKSKIVILADHMIKPEMNDVDKKELENDLL